MHDVTAARLDRAFVEDWGRRFGDAWNDQDPEAVLALCTDDIVWSDAALSAPAEGQQAVRDFAVATFTAFPDFRVEDTDGVYLSPIEPVALCPYRMTGTMLGAWQESGAPATRASFDLTGIDQWTFRGELMCRYVTYYDQLEMARQLSALPAASAS